MHQAMKFIYYFWREFQVGGKSLQVDISSLTCLEQSLAN